MYKDLSFIGLLQIGEKWFFERHAGRARYQDLPNYAINQYARDYALGYAHGVLDRQTTFAVMEQYPGLLPEEVGEAVQAALSGGLTICKRTTR